MRRVCHITTVHPAKDTRIYHKECRTLAAAGYDVKLVVVNANDVSSDYDGVEIVNVPVHFGSKLERMWKAPKLARQVAESLDASVYHFHDPEFLFSARKMSLKGLKVVYDSHEDVPNQIRNKPWLPRLARTVLAEVYKRLEHAIVPKLAGVVTVVDAIAERFDKICDKVVLVRNYPNLHEMAVPAQWSEKTDTVCYVGDLTTIRGVDTMVNALAGTNYRLNLGGKFSDEALKERIRKSEGWNLVNELGFLSRKDVMQVYATSKVGLVVLHPTPSYIDSLPVKMFEYMAAGIPYIASDFGLMKQITDEYRCGITVDPLDSEAVRKAILYLMENQGEAQSMGERGRKAVENVFNWANEEKQLLNLYADLI